MVAHLSCDLEAVPIQRTVHLPPAGVAPPAGVVELGAGGAAVAPQVGHHQLLVRWSQVSTMQRWQQHFAAVFITFGEGTNY